MIEATVYERPNGESRVFTIREVEPADEKYLIDNKVTISLEDVPPNLVGIYGKFSDDPNVSEAFVLVSMTKGSKVGMARLVEEIKRMKGEVE